MRSEDQVIATIQAAFEMCAFPGEAYLLGSSEGCEPEEEVGPFRDKRDWRTIEAEFLDAHAGALTFFSEAGFRFFLPAYLVADVKSQLEHADPLFHLTHGFYDMVVEAPTAGRVFKLRSGKSAFINPIRYGAATFGDYARYRLSVFAREEASAIVSYLEHKRENDESALYQSDIEAALNSFWLERARSAPNAESLRRHVAEQAAYLNAIQQGARERGS